MQPVWLCILPCEKFEETFENTQGRKAKLKWHIGVCFSSRQTFFPIENTKGTANAKDTKFAKQNIKSVNQNTKYVNHNNEYAKQSTPIKQNTNVNVYFKI